MKLFNKKNKKHLIIKKLLGIEGKRLSDNNLTASACLKSAIKLDVSHVTVLNYIKGDIKDGYLAEAILAELKKIK